MSPDDMADYHAHVVGWRERDWPEGFDRHTAELIAGLAAEALATPAPGKDSEGKE